jgi:iron complex outermembrane receptor protein
MRRITAGFFSSRQGLLPLGTWLFVLLGFGSSFAAEPPQAARYAIEQPSQGMADALRSIARQTGTSVLFEPATVAGRVARPVSGRLSPIEAIRAALQGTGMNAELMPDGVVVVKPSPTPPPAAPASSVPTGAPANGRGQVSNGDQNAMVAPAQRGVSAEPEHDESGAQQTLTRVEVTGSRLKRVDAEGPAPVNIYTRQDIERSGQPSLQRFLAGLSEVSASTGEGGFGSTLGQGTVQLRGLPLGSTLVLINGRRVEAVGSSTGSVFNLNLIPVAAIERVEVVPLGSSAVYGGDALAGVVNVILKSSLDGQSLAARMGSGRGFSDGSFSLTTGGRGAEGSYLLMGSYSRSTPLSMQDRSFFRDADYRRFGGTDERLNYCAPGTVSSTNGGNLPGLNSSFAGIPAVAAGQALRVSDFQATAGQQNLCNVWATGGGVALVHGYETVAVHSLAERRVFGSWSAFGEVTFVKDRMHAKDEGLLLDGVTVPASNPFNPFGVAVSRRTLDRWKPCTRAAATIVSPACVPGAMAASIGATAAVVRKFRRVFIQ